MFRFPPDVDLHVTEKGSHPGLPRFRPGIFRADSSQMPIVMIMNERTSTSAETSYHY